MHEEPTKNRTPNNIIVELTVTYSVGKSSGGSICTNVKKRNNSSNVKPLAAFVGVYQKTITEISSYFLRRQSHNVTCNFTNNGYLVNLNQIFPEVLAVKIFVFNSFGPLLS